MAGLDKAGRLKAGNRLAHHRTAHAMSAHNLRLGGQLLAGAEDPAADLFGKRVCQFSCETTRLPAHYRQFKRTHFIHHSVNAISPEWQLPVDIAPEPSTDRRERR